MSAHATPSIAPTTDQRRADPWYRALTIAERRARGHAARPVAGEAARRLLQRWREQPPFERGDLFAARLAADGLTEADLLALLDDPTGAAAGVGEAPDWAREVQALLATWAARAAEPLPAALAGGDPDRARLYALVAPLIRHGLDRLTPAVARLLDDMPDAPDAPDGPCDAEAAVAAWCVNLPGFLGQRLVGAVALAVNIARVQGTLEGATPEERFAAFARQLVQPDGSSAFFDGSPVLMRLLLIGLEQWVAAGLAFLTHLRDDWPAIVATFAPEAAIGPLVEIKGGAGDSHGGGRTTLLLRFASGFRLVYKPRSLAVDHHFHGLIAWLNAAGATPPLRAMRVLDRGDHGWAEFVAPAGCASPAAVGRFYERQGAYLALLHALEATDFHHENLIAAGEHPVLVDLEALFQPRVAAGDRGEGADPAVRSMAHSVRRVGLLPEHGGGDGAHRGVDASGLGGHAGQRYAGDRPMWEQIGTDSMRLELRPLELVVQANLPTLDGAAVSVLDHGARVVAGFRRMYALLRARRAELLAGPLAVFRQAEVRFIPRPTDFYYQLVMQSYHPDMLRDALRRERHLDQLWTEVPALPWLARLIPSERADLWVGDIPRYASRPDSRDVWDSRGAVIADLLPESGWAAVTARLGQMSDADLERQVWFIRAALATLPAGMGEVAWRGSELTPADAPPADAARLLAAARAIGDRLATLALHQDERVGWLGLTRHRDLGLEMRPTTFDLYSGVAGITLFLAALGAATGEARHADLARRGWATARRQLDDLRREGQRPTVGAFSGLGGVVYLAAHLAVAWEEPALLDAGEALAGEIEGLIDNDDRYDIIDGAAGAILCLLALHRVRPSAAALAAAVRCGDHLLRHAAPGARGGIGWVVPDSAAVPLTGFSHGTAGAALALRALAHATGAARFAAAATAALAYERGLALPAAPYWPDLRGATPDGDWTPPVRQVPAWCHGAPGIGLGRLAGLAYGDDATARQEIARAVEVTLADGFGLNHSLCHGDLGNLELLLMADRHLPDLGLRPRIAHLTAMILRSGERDGWSTGVPLGVETPDLMIGLAGIGLGLLRLADPDRWPSVLTLEPPRPGGAR